MVIIYRAVKKWDDMSAAEMLHALHNQHYYDPKDDSEFVDSGATYGNLDRGLHRGEVEVYGDDYRYIRSLRERQYLRKCKEKRIVPKELPKWAGD